MYITIFLKINALCKSLLEVMNAGRFANFNNISSQIFLMEIWHSTWKSIKNLKNYR